MLDVEVLKSGPGHIHISARPFQNAESTLWLASMLSFAYVLAFHSGPEIMNSTTAGTGYMIERLQCQIVYMLLEIIIMRKDMESMVLLEAIKK